MVPGKRRRKVCPYSFSLSLLRSVNSIRVTIYIPSTHHLSAYQVHTESQGCEHP